MDLLHASCRSPAAACAVRALVRHRDSLVRAGSEHLLRVKKSLDQMNSSSPGGDRHNRRNRAGHSLRHHQRRAQARGAGAAPRPTLQENRGRDRRRAARRLAPEHLFILRQSFEAWQYDQKLIAECETELRKQMDGLADQTKQAAPRKARPDKRCDETTRQHLFERFGVDLTAVDAINLQTAYTF